jgi:imidazolonepropionase
MMPAAFDLLLTGAHLATMRSDGVPNGEVRHGAVGIAGDRIAWVGRAADVPRDVAALHTQDCGGRWLTPGLVDCHTHLVHAGSRANEFERRLQGATYADIARAGGGINATVRATRAASGDELAAQSRPRLAALAAEGVTTVEIKSGYRVEAAHRRPIARRTSRRGRAYDAACGARAAAGIRLARG